MIIQRIHFPSYFCMIALVFAALVYASSSRAQSPSSINSQSIDTNHIMLMPNALRMTDAFGVRIGLGANQFSPGLEPVLNPYYEVRFSNTFLSMELFLAYENFSALTSTVFTGAGPATLASYGFHANFRWLTSPESDDHYFAGFGVGMDVYQTRVSATMPILFGKIIDISKITQVEVAARATPLVYIGKNIGFSYGIVAGLRFPNFSN